MSFHSCSSADRHDDDEYEDYLLILWETGDALNKASARARSRARQRQSVRQSIHLFEEAINQSINFQCPHSILIVILLV